MGSTLSTARKHTVEEAFPCCREQSGKKGKCSIAASAGLEPLEPRLLLSGSYSLEFVAVDNSSALSGYKTYDLHVTGDLRESGYASIIIELDEGSIYQDAAGSDRAPNPLLFDAYPGLEFDSYVTGNGEGTVITGPAEGLGGSAFYFDSKRINVNWGLPLFDSIEDADIMIGRFTLSDDASGLVALLYGEGLNRSSDDYTSWDTFTGADLLNRTPTEPQPGLPGLPVDPIPDDPVGDDEFRMRFVPVDNSSVLAGYKTFDLEVTTTKDWTASALLIELSHGSIYQDPLGSHLMPSPEAVSLFPTLEFDSYVTSPGRNTGVAGAAGDIGGDEFRFDSEKVDVVWFDLARNDIGTFTIARITLSNDAAGRVRVGGPEGIDGSDYNALISSEIFTGGNLVLGDSFVGTPEPITAGFVEVADVLAPEGYKTYDLSVNAEAPWLDASLRIDLSSGQIFQDPMGSVFAPNAATVSTFPLLEYDSYVTGSRLAYVKGDADGNADSYVFDTDSIDISWAGQGYDDTGSFVIGRFTISDDAIGSLKLVVSGFLSDPYKQKFDFDRGTLGRSVSSASRAADFTGDGMPDILWWNPVTGQNQLWQMDHTDFVSSIDLPEMPDTDWHAVGTADLTGDRRADILWRNSRNGMNMVTQMDGTDVVSNIAIKSLRSRAWVVAGVADFTVDGKADILWRNTKNGRNSVWEMDGTTFVEGVSIRQVKSQDWIIAGVGDLDSDGQTDILWRNTNNGRNWTWAMDGTHLQKKRAFQTVKNQRMQVIGIADYNGDGNNDILWRNTNNGGNVVWNLWFDSYKYYSYTKTPIRAQTDDGWQPTGTLLGLWE